MMRLTFTSEASSISIETAVGISPIFDRILMRWVVIQQINLGA